MRNSCGCVVARALALLPLLTVPLACSFNSSGIAPRRDWQAPADTSARDAGLDRPALDGDGQGRDLPVDQPRADRPPTDVLPVDGRPADRRPVDKRPVDKRPPDKSPPPDSRQWPGAPCPCQSHLACWQGVCRTKCTRNACLQSADCTATEACVNTTTVGEICLPGVTSGQCGWQSPPFCQQGYLCVSSRRSGNVCRKLCTTSTRACSCYSLTLPGCKACF